MQRISVTREGFSRMHKELKRLREVERPAVIQSIAIAREHGDLSENAEYHAAREKQSFLEGRIAELETVLSKADIVDPSQFEGSSNVRFGAKVQIIDKQTGSKQAYQIVSEHESNIEDGRLASNSPLARAMMGKEVNETIEVRSPRGLREYKIIEVRFE